jgi:hypothetical protein
MESWKRRLHSATLANAVKLPVEPEAVCEDNMRLSEIAMTDDRAVLCHPGRKVCHIHADSISLFVLQSIAWHLST